MNILIDIKYTLRLMITNPGFSLLTIAIMTIGLGITMYNYSFIHGLMLKELPFKNGDRMYTINSVQNGIEYNGGTMRVADYLLIRDELEGVDNIGAYYFNTVNVSDNQTTVRYPSVSAEAVMFEFTGIEPFVGRVLNEQDTQAGANPVTVISYQLWQSYFAGRKDILGQYMTVEGEQTEIVGVMPNGFQFPTSMQLWLPMTEDLHAINRNQGPTVEIFFTLTQGHSIDDVNAQLATIMQRSAEEFPETNSGTSAMAKTYRMSMIGNGGYMIMSVMLTAVLFILALACTNVGNILLARANERSKETAVRVALGAPRWRLITQMMWESLLICAISGVFAILLAGWGLQVSEGIMAKIINGPIPYFWHFGLDSHIVIAAIFMVLFTAVITGLIPALKMTSGDFNAVLRDGTRGAQGRKSSKVSNILVVMEIALSCCLLTVAAVLAISAQETTSADYGVDTHNRFVAEFEMPQEFYEEDDARTQFYRDLIAQLEAQPEVARAGIARTLPGQYTAFTGIEIEGQEIAEGADFPRVNSTRYMPQTLEVLGLNTLEGRLFDEQDHKDAPFVAVVTDSFAKKHFDNNANAIGKRFRYSQAEEPRWYEIVGVVPHVIYGQPYQGLKERPSVFVSAIQSPRRHMDIIIIPADGQAAMNMFPVLRRSMAEVDARVPIIRPETYDDRVLRNTGGLRFIAGIFQIMAIAALALAASGIYGVMANAIEQRTHEFGVRRALGATDESVIKMLLVQGGIRFLIGAAIGAPLAYLLGNQMVSQFGAESPLINWMYFAMPILIGVVVLFATLVPARRAVRFEPSSALRYE